MLRSIAAGLVAVFILATQANAQLLTDQGELFGWYSYSSPYPVAITGLDAGERILAIDRSRVNNKLYGVTATRLYSIDEDTAAATAISGVGAFHLTGTGFDIEARPSDGVIRVITNGGQNLSVDPITGAVIRSDPLAFRPGDINAGRQANIVAVAYNVYGGGDFYGVDADLDDFVTIDESTGLITTIGHLGVDVTVDSAFDVAGPSLRGTLLTNPAGSTATQMYELNPPYLRTRYLGTVGKGYRIVDLATSTVPEPATWALMLIGFGGLGLSARRARHFWAGTV